LIRAHLAPFELMAPPQKGAVASPLKRASLNVA
jgi:hypothetical protein